MSKKITTNYIYNLAYKILTLIVPLITTPYLSRVLGAEGIGIFHYCMSIVTYFTYAGNLGTPLYGKREIAAVRDNREQRNQLFSDIVIMQCGLIILSLLLYLAVIPFFHRYETMFIICAVGIVANIFDINWLYAGLEEFPRIVFRNVIVKTISVASIFAFVRQKDDLYIYAICMMLSNLLGNLWLFIGSREYVKLVKPKFKNMPRYLKSSTVLMLPTLVTVLYASIDKTMIGTLSNSISEVGYYEQSQKIITMSIAVVTSLGAVLMPRLSALFSGNDIEGIKKYVNYSMMFCVFISLPMAFCLATISDNLVPWFFGPGFEKVENLLLVFSPMLIFMGVSDLIGTQLLISTRNEKVLLIVNIIAVLINCCLNFLLIPQYYSIGAAIATVVSEGIKTFVFLFIEKYYLSFKLISYCFKCCLLSAFMSAVILSLKKFVFGSPIIINTALLMMVGITVYMVIMFVTKDPMMLRTIGALKKRFGQSRQ